MRRTLVAVTAVVSITGASLVAGPVALGADASLPAGDPSAPIVVWLDETRLPAIDAWKAAHPDQAGLVTSEVVDILQIPAKISLANNAREMLEQTEHALARLDDGTYGTCESCGNPIGKMRLQAAPRATLCMPCKTKQERR